MATEAPQTLRKAIMVKAGKLLSWLCSVSPRLCGSKEIADECY